MKRITITQVLQLHNKMIRETGGYYGIRDPALLESALYNALTTFDGNELYPSIEEKCANVYFCIIKNHPFVDGNKRMRLFIMLWPFSTERQSLPDTATRISRLFPSIRHVFPVLQSLWQSVQLYHRHF